MPKYFVTCGSAEAGIRQVVEADDDLGAAVRAFLRGNYRPIASGLPTLTCVSPDGFADRFDRSRNQAYFLDTLVIIRTIENSQ